MAQENLQDLRKEALRHSMGGPGGESAVTDSGSSGGGGESGRSPEEERIIKMYGKLPSRNELLQKKLKDRKFFDSGDYAMSKAGKQTTQIGSEHPVPEIIPHHTTSPPQSRHPSVSMGSSVTTAFAPGSIAAHEIDEQLRQLGGRDFGGV